MKLGCEAIYFPKDEQEFMEHLKISTDTGFVSNKLHGEYIKVVPQPDCELSTKCNGIPYLTE